MAGSHLSDFVGYEVGSPPAVVNAGFVGLLDFTGIPTGGSTFVPPVEPPVTPVLTNRVGGWGAVDDFVGRRRRKRYRDDDDIIILLK